MAGQTQDAAIGGKTYTLSPWCPKDFAEFAKHLREQRYALHCRHSATMTEAVAERIALKLLSAHFTDDDLRDHLHTPEGGLFMIWRSVLKLHPDVTLDSLSPTPEEVETVSRIINAMTGGGENPPPAADQSMKSTSSP